MFRICVGLAAGVLALSTAANAQVYVQGHFRSDGTYVQPYYRSQPNGTPADNWSTKGNVNPYTGQEGAKNPYQPPKIQRYTPPEPSYPSYVPPPPPVRPYAGAYPPPCRYRVINGIIVCG